MITQFNKESYKSYFNKVDISGVPNDLNLSDYIPIGKHNAKTSRKIAALIGISDRRTEVRFRALVNERIEAGELIGSCSKGFFYINTFEELSRTVEGLRHRRDGIDRHINNLLRNWKTREKQTELKFDDPDFEVEEGVGNG